MTSPIVIENAMLRRIEQIERDLRELGPSVAKSTQSIVAGLAATVADVEAQSDALADVVADLATAQADIIAQQSLIVTAQAVGNSTNTFAITTSYTNRATANLTVPNGFTKCVVQATATVGALNSTGSADALYVNVMINGVAATGTVVMTLPNGAFGSIDGIDGTVLTGLTNGQSIPVVARVKSLTSTFPSSVNNRAQVNAFAVFYN